MSPRWRSSERPRQDVLDRVRRRGATTRRRYAREVADALRHRPPRVARRAQRDRGAAEARLALRRAVRRPLGDPELLPRRADAAARDRRAERRRRRRELRGLHALPRPGVADRMAALPTSAQVAIAQLAAFVRAERQRAQLPLATRPGRRLVRCCRRTSATRCGWRTSTRGSGATCTRPSSASIVGARSDCAERHHASPYLDSDAEDEVNRHPRRRRADVPARRPAREDGHRQHGAFARGAVAAPRSSS